MSEVSRQDKTTSSQGAGESLNAIGAIWYSYDRVTGLTDSFRCDFEFLFSSPRLPSLKLLTDRIKIAYEGRSKSFAIHYDAQTTQAKQLHHFSILSPFTSAQLQHWSKGPSFQSNRILEACCRDMTLQLAWPHYHHKTSLYEDASSDVPGSIYWHWHWQRVFVVINCVKCPCNIFNVKCHYNLCFNNNNNNVETGGSRWVPSLLSKVYETAVQLWCPFIKCTFI